MAKTYSCLLVGLDVIEIEIETVIGKGFSGLSILGLQSDIVRDMRERVRSALESIGIFIPAKRVVVNISPREILKLARTPLSELDFAVAASVILALFEDQGIALPKIEKEFFAGELSLCGDIKSVQNTLIYEKISNFYASLCTDGSFAKQSGLLISISGEKNYPYQQSTFKSYLNLSDWLSDRKNHNKLRKNVIIENQNGNHLSDFSVGKIQKAAAIIQKLSKNPKACVASLVAVSGWHHLLLIGEPGIGKSFCVQYIKDLFLPPNKEQQIEIQLIYSQTVNPHTRPFRKPHHSSTVAALVGGQSLKPGEVTLAHHGVLFLDEIAEFSRNALESLREPLDSGHVELSKSLGNIRYPADFLLCATANPCPCGYLFSENVPCRCRPSDSKKYMNKLSGPLLDRFCLQVFIEHPNRYLENKKDIFSEYLSYLISDEIKLFEFVKNFFQVQNTYQKSHRADIQFDTESPVSIRSHFKIKRLIETFSKIFPMLSHENTFTDQVLTYRNLSDLMNKDLIHL